MWEWFREVFTGDPLPYTELHHWSLVTGKSLKGWEAELIRSLDRIYWSVHNERFRKP